MSLRPFDTVRTQKWLDGIAGLGARSHVLTMLKGLLSLRCQSRPVRATQDHAEREPSSEIENYLKPPELKRLDAALDKLSRSSPSASWPSARSMLLLTGMRKSEALTLTWSMST